MTHAHTPTLNHSAKALHPSTRSLWWAVLSATFVIRLAALVIWLDDLEKDPDAYRALAENLYMHGVFGAGGVPTAYRPPLYSLFLLPLLKVQPFTPLAIGALHLALGLATVIATIALGRLLAMGNWAFAAGLFVGVDPLLLYQSAQVMTETLATLLGVVVLLCVAGNWTSGNQKYAALAGAVAGMAGLTRPVFLPWLVCVPLAMTYRGHRAGRWRAPAVCVMAIGAVLAPWVIRNALVVGSPVVATTHGGYTLWLANNPSFYAFVRQHKSGEIWTADEFDAQVQLARDTRRGVSEVEHQREEYAMARRAMRQDPTGMVRAGMYRVRRLWSPLAMSRGPGEGRAATMLRWCAAAWFTVEFLLAAWGLLIGRPSWRNAVWILALALVVCVTATHWFYWTDIRMRAPLVPVIALAAGGGLAALWRPGWRSHPAQSV